MKRIVWTSFLLLVACGGSERDVTVTLESSSLPLIDPYAVEANLRRVRVRLVADGPETVDETAADLALDQKSITFEGIQDPATLEIRAEGYDELGNVVAYGRKLGVDEEGDVTVTFPLRRNVAYLTHLPDPEAMNPERQVYVLDVATRAYIGKVALPGAGTARQVTARGGKSILVTYEEGGLGKVGVLDAGTHEWKTIDLMGVQEIALAVDASPIGVVAGGDVISFIDVDAGTYIERFRQNVGGRVLDAAMSEDGAYAIVIVDREPGGVFVDVKNRTVQALGVVNQPGGVGIGEGRVAYVTSLSENTVSAVDLASRTGTNYSGSGGIAGSASWAESLQSMFAIKPGSSGIADVLSMTLERTPTGFVLVSDSIGKTLVNPVGVVVDGSGRRVLIAAPGDEDTPSGLTMVAGRPGGIPVSSNLEYPRDPDDTYTLPMSEVVLRRQYRPRSAAIVYGR